MAKAITTYALVLVLAVSTPVYAANIIFNSSILQNVPENRGVDLGEVASYEIVPYNIDRNASVDRAESLFNDNPVAVRERRTKIILNDSEDDLRFTSGNVQLWISKPTGSEIFIDLSRFAFRENQSRTVIKASLRKEAAEYIAVQLPNVDSGEVEYISTNDIMDAIVSVDSLGKLTSEVEIQAANYVVAFGRIIDNIPLIGPGDNVQIVFSSNGDIIGHSSIWREINRKPVTVKPILSTLEILDAFVEEHSSDKVENIEVDQLYLDTMRRAGILTNLYLNPIM